MKKLQGSIGAKIVAWIVCFFSIVLFLGSAIVASLMDDEGIYTRTKEEEKKSVFENVSQNYSLAALSFMHEGEDPEEYFANTNFKYGIIKSNDVSKVDLNQDASYVVRNFSEQVKLEDLYQYSCNLTDNTYFSFNNTPIGRSYYYFRNSDEGQHYSINQALYDPSQGIFYYPVNDHYYPVKEVEIVLRGEGDDGYDFDGYKTFYYNAEQNAYENETAYSSAESYEEIYDTEDTEEGMPVENSITSSATAKDDDASVSESASESSNDTASTSTTDNTTTTDNGYTADDAANASTQNQKIDINQFLRKSMVTFNLLDQTDNAYQNWGDNDIYLDDYAYSMPNDIKVEALTDEQKAQIITYDNYSQNSYKELCDTFEEDKKTAYTVVALIPETLENAGNWSAGDSYVKADMLIDLAYNIRYAVFAFLVLSLILGLGSVIFLVQAAGHRKDTEEIVPMWIDKIPADLLAAIVCVAEGVCFYFMVEDSYYMYESTLGMFVMIMIGIASWIIAMIFLLSFAVHVKLGKWWRKTIVGYVFAWIGRCFAYIGEHISILWKSAIIMFVIGIIELVVILATGYDPEIEVFFWVLEKMLLYGVIVLGLVQMKQLQEAGKHIAEGDLNYKVNTKKMFWEFRKHGEDLNHIGEGISKAVDERMKSEHFKTELITNVSHDIKTPLTSIINYVDLLEKEELDNPVAQEYLEVLDRQSSRLKKLIEDLMEASKASTGNLSVSMELCEAGVFLVQTVGEFKEKTDAVNLDLLIKKPEYPVYMMADGRHFWRVIDNMMNNICKYAQPGTRVYINLEAINGNVLVTFRNTSKAPLNISSEELMERFVRGDSSRNTEGSGLGLNIAKSLTELMNGKFNLVVDGDLFKVVLIFPQVPGPQQPQEPMM